MLDPDSPDVRRAVFGKQVEHFLKSDIGVYLTQCAAQDIDEALTKLKDVDAEDPKAIRDLQFKVRVAERVVGWLSDALNAGEQATELLKEGE